jgi:CheY-like chemotaxis protein
MSSCVARVLELSEHEIGLSVLLAVGDPPLLRMLGQLLKRDGHEVVEACDGAQLLEAMERAAMESGISPFDMIICDDRLSDLHMLSVLWSLRTHLPEGTAFALLTEDAEMQGRARELGAFTLLSPLTVRSLRAAACQAAERWAENDKGRTG